MAQAKMKLANHELVTLVVYLLGGKNQCIATEDIAVKANQIAPRRFAWRKYPDQIDLEAVRKRLDDAKRPAKGAYLVGSAKAGWMLTESGLNFSETAAKKLSAGIFQQVRETQQERNWRRRERIRILGTAAFQRWQAGDGEAITLREAQELFRLDDYVTGAVRERKLARFANTFAHDAELGEIIVALAKRVREGT